MPAPIKLVGYGTAACLSRRGDSRRGGDETNPRDRPRSYTGTTPISRQTDLGRPRPRRHLIIMAKDAHLHVQGDVNRRTFW